MEINNENTIKNCKIIIDLINLKEKSYLNNITENFGKVFVDRKIEEMNQIIRQIETDKIINLDTFEQIRKIAISKGGFINNSYRREFYKQAFIFGNKNKLYSKYDHLYGQNNTKEKNMDKCINFDYIIEVDVKRSIINHFIDRNLYDTELNLFKEHISTTLKKFIQINNPKYHYYQGFHEIGLYIFILFFNYEHYGLEIIQKISEFLLKDYIVLIDESREIEQKNNHFKFETVFNILDQIIEKINPEVSNILKQDTNITQPLYALPWVITLLTHDITNLFNEYRIMDYLLFSHPHSIYHLAANVQLNFFYFIFFRL
jgi:hypothetical protein